MKSHAMIALMLLLVSCGPSEGDVYKHKLTETRYMIEIAGPCTDVYSHYSVKNDSMEASGKEGLWIWTPSEDEGSSMECVGMVDDRDHVTIERADFFEQQYTKAD